MASVICKRGFSDIPAPCNSRPKTGDASQSFSAWNFANIVLFCYFPIFLPMKKALGNFLQKDR